MSQLRVNTVTNAGGTGSTYAPGHVVQVVTATTSTTVSTTSGSFVTTGLSASITPSSTSSRVMVVTQTTGQTPNSSTSGTWTLFRGTVAGVNLGNGTNGQGSIYLTANNEIRLPISFSIVDSPNTTSSQTYTLGFRTNASGSSISSQASSGFSSITLMEIAQ